MKKLLLIVFIALIVISLESCTLAKISGRGNTPLVLNNLPTQVEMVDHFKVDKMKTFDYTGATDVSEVLTEKLDKKGDAITNLTIVIKTDPATFFVNLFTLGLANAYIVEVEGDLVNLPQGFGSLKESGAYNLSQISENEIIHGDSETLYIFENNKLFRVNNN